VPPFSKPFAFEPPALQTGYWNNIPEIQNKLVMAVCLPQIRSSSAKHPWEPSRCKCLLNTTAKCA